MNKLLSKYLFYYPVTLAKGELIAFYRRGYEERQWWSARELEAFRDEHFDRIVRYAVENSSYYQKCLSSFITDNSIIPSPDLPTLSKAQLIDNLDHIRAKNAGLFSSAKTTGGSTGEPVKIFKNGSALARERCATWRSYEWAGVSVADRQVRFWGVPHSRSGRLTARLIDLIANRKRISAFSINDDNLYKYYNDLCSFQPQYLYGYVSVIEEFARFIQSKQLQPPSSLVSLITTSEVLSDSSRALIENAFQRKVFNEYGCGEVGSIAHECEYGSMHVMADNLHVEIDSEPGQPGEIIVTDYFNQVTPLVRYRLGDFATMGEGTCRCGRELPTINKIHGRAYDIIRSPSGTRIHPEAVIYIFEGIQEKMPVFKQFQAIQTDIDAISVNIVPNVSWDDSFDVALKSQLVEAIGAEFRFEVNLVESLSREKSGKMRVVKSMLD
ncbi:phenylacetate--CoA ligase family protein [Marinobacter salarius]|uniref:phenylacetate--CoA ligase family protein n=1 Tax=Marinobacter salarius TaxID=1420917 RepID=UPI003D9C3124